MCEQREATCAGVSAARGTAGVFSLRRLGLPVGRRFQQRLRCRTTGQLAVQHFAICRKLGYSRLRPQLAGADRLRAVAAQNQVVVPFFFCPTRRLPRTRPMPVQFPLYNSAPLQVIVRSDYSANSGDFGDALVPGRPEGPPPSQVATFNWDNAQRNLTGVCYVKSEIDPAAITDGLSKTLLIGEENLNPNEYDSGAPLNDNQAPTPVSTTTTTAWRAGNFRRGPIRSARTGSRRSAAQAHHRMAHGHVRRLGQFPELRRGHHHGQPTGQPQRRSASLSPGLNI